MFSCEGHDDIVKNSFEIMFDDSVSDYQICNFLEIVSKNRTYSPVAGNFVKWARKNNGKIILNWMYSVAYGSYIFNQKIAHNDYEKMKTFFNA